MNKSDLRNGMIVKVTGYDTKEYNGLMMYLGGSLFDINEWDRLENFYMNDEEYNEGLKIVAVYEFISRYDDEISSLKDILKESNINKLKLLWRDEREIDWRKVPRLTRVQVRNSKKGEWINRYFRNVTSTIIDIDQNTETTYWVAVSLPDEFTGVEAQGFGGFRYCRIHPSVDIKNEWYK